MQIADLRAQRQAAGWTVSELARRSNTSDLTIDRLEDGAQFEDYVCRRVLDALGDAPKPPALTPQPAAPAAPVVSAPPVEPPT